MKNTKVSLLQFLLAKMMFKTKKTRFTPKKRG
jgi:hypothetical protein